MTFNTNVLSRGEACCGTVGLSTSEVYLAGLPSFVPGELAKHYQVYPPTINKDKYVHYLMREKTNEETKGCAKEAGVRGSEWLGFIKESAARQQLFPILSESPNLFEQSSC